MKTLLFRAAATFALACSFHTHAANVTLDGSGSYRMETSIRYYGGGVKQNGRYSNLGADYYHKVSYGMDWVTNRSTNSSGPLSIEFWGMPYYGATSGIVLMTRGANPLGGGKYYYDKTWTGWKVYLDEFRFPEISLWESTRKGWRFRDALSFRRKTLL